VGQFRNVPFRADTLEVFVFTVLGAPFLVAVLLGTALARDWVRTIVLMGVGLLVGLAFVLYFYYSAPVDYQHDLNGCSDCAEYLGRWWEPGFAFFLVGIGYLSWLVGIGVGALLNALLRSSKKPIADGAGRPVT
jgi:hypothetical protein